MLEKRYLSIKIQIHLMFQVELLPMNLKNSRMNLRTQLQRNVIIMKRYTKKNLRLKMIQPAIQVMPILILKHLQVFNYEIVLSNLFAMLYHIIFHTDQVSRGNADTSVHVEFELAKKKMSSFQRSFQRSYLETIGKK